MKSFFKTFTFASLIAILASGSAYANHHKKHHAKKHESEKQTEMTQEKTVLQKEEKVAK